jgi:Cellulose binding domain
MAVRRVMVTPTFAAGLGVVIAGVLALSTTRTVISFGNPQPGGHACAVVGCVTPTPSGGLATARPGRRLVAPRPAVKDRHTAGTSAGTQSGPGGTPPGDAPVMTYQPLRPWQDGFVAKITITGPGSSGASGWTLQLSYASAHIIGVWGARWQYQGAHSVLIQPGGDGYFGDGGGGGGGGGDGGSGIQVILAVSGAPGAPSGCVFNGHTCRSG